MPKEILYTRKIALGIGLIKLLITVETLALKLYVGNKRVKNRIAKLLSIIEDLQFIENRINQIPINANHEEKYWKAIWIDNIVGILSKWVLKITNGKELHNKIMTNEIIMDLILEYMKEMKDRNKILNKINQVRLYKKAYLPFELLEMKGQ